MIVSSVTLTAALLVTASALAHPSLEERKSRFTFYDIPTAGSGPCDLAVGPDGALWGEGILVNEIFRVDPKTGKVTEYKIPFTGSLDNTTIPGVPQIISDRTALSCAIRAGEDGNMYASNGIRNQLVRINPRTKKIKILQPPPNPAGNLQPFNDLTPAPGGMYMTQTSGNVFQFFNFTDESFTTYECPTPASFPLGLRLATNGLLYVVELIGNNVLEFNPKTKKIVEYPLPELLQGPAVVRGERNGYVYFSLFTGNGIGRINTKTKKIDIYHTNQLGALGAEDTIDNDGGVWLSFFTVDALARLDTNTLKYSYIPFPKSFAKGGLNGLPGAIPPYVDVPVNYGPGNAIWFASLLENKVGRYSLD